MSAAKWKIVSGGQTGVDRAALDAARALGLPYGGFIPKGRRTEDGRLPDDYAGMTETKSAHYAVRTRRNVTSAHATLILTRGAPEGGTLLTLQAVRRAGKPLLVVDLAEGDPELLAQGVADWLDTLPGGELNVAGPRESGLPGIYAQCFALLTSALRETKAVSAGPGRAACGRRRNA